MPYISDKELMQIIEDDEAERVEFKESLSGSSPEGIREAICAFANDLPRREQQTPLYPFAALQQIVRNAVMHRTYEATNAPIRVSWFNDRIEILSPGGAFGAVTAENFGAPGLTDYRNPNLAEAMKNLGYVQRFGAGIPMAQKLLEDAGHPEPEFEVNSSYVLTTIKSSRNLERI